MHVNMYVIQKILRLSIQPEKIHPRYQGARFSLIYREFDSYILWRSKRLPSKSNQLIGK